MKAVRTGAKYRELRADIGRLYERAQQVVAGAYWKVGRRLVEEAQGDAKRAQYRARLLERLSADLSSR